MKIETKKIITKRDKKREREKILKRKKEVIN